MPFKSNYGNSSAKSAWGQWASFSLGLGKLGGYKGGTPSLSLKSFEIPKEQADWANVALIGASVFNAYADQKKEDSAKDVDKFLNSHSVTELNDLMKTRQIPFQDDPWAMSHFKFKMGQMHSGIAEQGFQQEITQGKYKGLSAAEVDSAHYAYMENYMKQLGIDTGGEHGAEDDKKFREGFFSLAPKQRLTAIASQQGLEQQRLTEENAIISDARVASKFTGRTLSADNVLQAFDEEWKTGGYQGTPSQWTKTIKNGLSSVVDLSQNPIEAIKSLRDKPVPGGDGKTTFDQRFGADYMDALVIKAGQAEFRRNKQLQYAFEDACNNLREEGDVESLKELREEALKESGGVETERIAIINKAISGYDSDMKALKKKATAELLKEQVQAEKEEKAKDYWGLARVDKVPPMQSMPFTAKTGGLVLSKMLEEGELSPRDLLTIAYNDSVSPSNAKQNPARQAIYTVASTAFGEINSLIHSKDDPFKNMNPEDVRVPDSVQTALALYDIDHNAFAVTSGKTSIDDLDKLNVMTMAMEYGNMSWPDIINGMRREAQLKESGKGTLSKKTLNELLDDDSFWEGVPRDSYTKRYITWLALSQVDTLGGDVRPALEKAKAQLLDSHVVIKDAAIPNGFFGVTDIDPEVVSGIILDDIDKTVGDNPNITVSYNPQLNNIGVYDKTSTNPWIPKKVYSQEDCRNLTSVLLNDKRDSLIEEEESRQETRVAVRDMRAPSTVGDFTDEDQAILSDLPKDTREYTEDGTPIIRMTKEEHGVKIPTIKMFKEAPKPVAYSPTNPQFIPEGKAPVSGAIIEGYSKDEYGGENYQLSVPTGTPVMTQYGGRVIKNTTTKNGVPYVQVMTPQGVLETFIGVASKLNKGDLINKDYVLGLSTADENSSVYYSTFLVAKDAYSWY